MGRDDLLNIDGVVTDVLSGGRFSVKLADGRVIPAKLSGRLRKYFIRVIAGDRVTIGLSPYDLSHGLIVAREKVESNRPPVNRR
jgi:translation initiation factor IF-1